MKFGWSPLLLRKHRSYPSGGGIHLYNEGLVGAFLRASKASVAVDDHDRDLGLSFNRLVSGLVMKL